MSNVGVVVVHYGDWRLTHKCITSLKRYSKSTIPIFIVTPNYQQRQISTIAQKYSSVFVIPLKGNLGFAGSSNAGIKTALANQNESVILLNNDTYINSDIVTGMQECIKKNDRIGLISPKIYFAPGKEYYTKEYKRKQRGRVIWYAGGKIDWANIYPFHRGVDEVDIGQYNRLSDTDFATGCCVCITKKLIDTIGFFDPKYFLYFEDVDLSIRAKRANFKVIYNPQVAIWHFNASSTENPGSNLHVYYQTRNRLYFGYKYATARVKKSLFLESIRFLLTDTVKRKAVIDYYFGRMGQVNT